MTTFAVLVDFVGASCKELCFNYNCLNNYCYNTFTCKFLLMLSILDISSSFTCQYPSSTWGGLQMGAMCMKRMVEFISNE